jgi:dTDP-4-amino-4,6-dideoxygalactose transaminase
LYAQLERYNQIQAKRRWVWEYYLANLHSWALKNSVNLPFVPDYCEQPYHMFYMLLPSLKSRQGLIEHLKSRGILAVFHYLPLHLSDMGRAFDGQKGDCPVTEDISDRLVRLPLYYELSEADLAYIVDAIHSFR